MSNTELIKQLRNLTQAPMKDCRDALLEANDDLNKAIDIVKIKGLNIISGREGMIASEGIVTAMHDDKTNSSAMMEINCQTDFVARSPAFEQFAMNATSQLLSKTLDGKMFSVSDLDLEKKQLISTTKENIVIKRWWVEQGGLSTKVFQYVHSNNKIGVLLTLFIDNKEKLNDPLFVELGNDLAMQIAAMSPLAVSTDRLSVEVIDHQTKIFEAQLKDLNKPEAAWAKIIAGKTAKWHTEVCLLNQESVTTPKSTVQQVIDKIAHQLNSQITVINFIRCQVGEGLDKVQENLSDEVNKLINKL